MVCLSTAVDIKMSEPWHAPFSGVTRNNTAEEHHRVGGGHGALCVCERLSVMNGGTGIAGRQEALINVGNSHPCIMWRGPRREGQDQQHVKNELFVNTINSSVFVRKPFVIRKPHLVKDVPGFPVRRAIRRCHIMGPASAGLSEALGNAGMFIPS